MWSNIHTVFKLCVVVDVPDLMVMCRAMDLLSGTRIQEPRRACKLTGSVAYGQLKR